MEVTADTMLSEETSHRICIVSHLKFKFLSMALKAFRSFTTLLLLTINLIIYHYPQSQQQENLSVTHGLHTCCYFCQNPFPVIQMPVQTSPPYRCLPTCMIYHIPLKVLAVPCVSTYH